MFKPFNRCAPFKPPPYVLPRDARGERGGAWPTWTFWTIRSDLRQRHMDEAFISV